MGIKFAKDIIKEIEKRGPITVPSGNVTGEAYEEWLYEGIMKLPYTGEVIDLKECDRITAIMVIHGKMYTSDCDHQDCYQEYCDEHGIDSGFDWNDVDNFDEVQAAAASKTNALFQDKSEDVYGFDIFEAYDDQYYLTSHFPSNMEACYDMMVKYAKENDCKLGTFFDHSYKIKLISDEN